MVRGVCGPGVVGGALTLEGRETERTITSGCGGSSSDQGRGGGVCSREGGIDSSGAGVSSRELGVGTAQGGGRGVGVKGPP